MPLLLRSFGCVSVSGLCAVLPELEPQPAFMRGRMTSKADIQIDMLRPVIVCMHACE